MPETHDRDKQKERVLGLLPASATGWVKLFVELRENLGQLSVRKQILIGFAGLLVALVSGFFWWSSYKNVSERIQTGLDAKIENTVDQHKGLAAYLLSNLEPKPASTPELSLKMMKVLKDVEAVVSERSKPLTDASLTAAQLMAPPQPSPSTSPVPDKPSPSPSLAPDSGDSRKLKLKINICGDMPSDSPLGQALVAGDDSFYFFLPVMSVRRERMNNYPLKEDDDNALREALDHNPDILRDLSVAWDLIPKLKNFDNLFINGQEVAQVYFISESGMILLRSAGIENQLEFYRQQFGTNHSFADRPYFWHAVSNENVKPETGFNYTSEPYIDLGGHGLIKTHSKAFRLANGRYGVLGVDVRLDPKLKEEIVRRLAVMGGQTESYRTDSAEDVGKLDNGFQWVRRGITKDCPQDTILGKITSQKDFPSESGDPQDDIYRYSIPWSTRLKDGKTRSVELMLVRIDFSRFWLWLYLLPILMCGGVVLVLAVTYNIIENRNLLTSKLSELALKIDKVMAKAETPYVRLNSNNEFVEANQKFLDMVEYGNIQQLQNEAKTFIHLLTPDSQEVYKRKMEESKNRADTDEYTITLLRRHSPAKIRARVHGESIDFPTFMEQEYPHRFGIVISWEFVKNGAQEPVQPSANVNQPGEVERGLRSEDDSDTKK